MSFQIPISQRVAVVPKAGGAVEIKTDWPVKQQKDLAPGECLVKIESSGLYLSLLKRRLRILTALQDAATPISTPPLVTGLSRL